MTQVPARTTLIIGATGAFGHAAAQALLAHGWRVRALTRDPEAAAQGPARLDGLQWIRGDAMTPADVIAAAAGADVVVHAANPPRYRGWPRLAPAMLESSIAAAEAAGARLVFPGTVYNFDPTDQPVICEDSPQRPSNPKGAIRVAMERRLEAASKQGLRVLILRAGDFFGPPPSNSWLTAAMVTAKGRPGKVVYPGDPKVGRAWAYLPDLGETLARLLDQEGRLGRFARFHFGGHWLSPGVEMAEAVRRAAGDPRLPIRPFPWFAIRAMAPFNETFQGLLDTRYLWRQPLRLDNARLVEFLGAEPHTPLDEAVRASLPGLTAPVPRTAEGALVRAAMA